MKAITIMYDSLNRNYLPCYGDTESITPNFKRLAEKTVTFDKFYVGSLPCIPARRELHTGRYNFMHRCWGPLEPFDDSMPAILGEHGIYSHCVTDHAHYWQEGGSTYHTKFSSCEMIRGQEGDFWAGKVDGFEKNLDLHRQDGINRQEMQGEENHPHYKTYQAGMKFLEDNCGKDNWYLHIEYFDPHEPYFVPDKYKKMYTDQEADFDWPFYGEVEEESKEVKEARLNYRAVLSMMDHYLGKFLDFMDEHDMWKDTMLIVNTDHGYLLGEHGYFGKNYMPNYEQITHTPFFLHHPGLGCDGERRDELAQTIDIAPTILDCFHIEKPKDMLGMSLLPVVGEHKKIHDYILFGYFGKHVNITDGRYVYMRSGRSAEKGLLNNYTLVPLHMFEPFSVAELKEADRTLTNEFSFTKGAPVMKIPASGDTSPNNSCYWFERHMKYGDLLFDLEKDPQQLSPVDDPETEERLKGAMKRLMQENEAPAELYERIDL
ncbi:sulfatase-like hydrolase/transferase [Clostridium sp. MCC353]|uniref:sulfatase n=1 Tax=Clostridium sp. MCC353 TaxID=2592646 RepID=UPI001C0334FF|nr:sulfatase [Clostridium sp. MCC353]MBT9778539.1 sulfatase-like hydrolase/transferase [Clostridium sp. MCC353]